MPEQVNIASLTIDADEVVKESVKLKKVLDNLKKSQKELKNSTEDTTEEQVKNEIQIKKLSKAYRDNQNFATALDKSNEDLTKTMSVQGKSTQELRDSRRELNKISAQLDGTMSKFQGTQEEELKLREDLNKAIDLQTEALRNQGSEFNSSKDQIGEYTQGINTSDLSLQGLAKQSQEAGGATKLLANGTKAAVKSLISMTKAALAFIATPVGVVLAIIAGAFLLIKNAMNRSEESTTKVKKAFSAFSGIVKGLLKFLEPLGEFLIDGLVKGFELVEKGIFKALGAIQKGLKFLGLDDAAEGLGNFTREIEESVKASKELTQAELDLAKAQRIARKVQLDYQKDAEKLRQIRDDETKSFPERIKANTELGALLKKQGEEELALAQKALDVANLRIKLDGETVENLDAQADALTEIADIEERITGQISEQLVNRVSLEREAADKVREIEDQKAKDSEESAKKKMEADKKAAEAAVELAQFELSEYIRANKSKLDSNRFLTSELVKEEEKRLNELAVKRREFEAIKLEEGQISQLEYNEAIAVIDEENQAKIGELRIEREEAEKLRTLIDAENELIFLEEKGRNQHEVLLTKLNKDRQAELAEAEKTGADKALIEAKYKAREQQIDNAVFDSKIDSFGQVFDSYAELLGKETKAGKAAAIASTLISTYQGAQQAFTSLSSIPVVGTVLGVAAAGAAIIAGLKQVSKIKSTPTKLSKGDILGGRSHANGGNQFTIDGVAGYEHERGEALINKRSTSMFAPLLSAINVAGGGKKFANGTILGSTSSSSSLLIDYDLLAIRLAEANMSLPAPIVSVEEIKSVSDNITVVESLASS